MKSGIIAFLLGFAFAGLFHYAAHPRDLGQYSGQSPELREWFKSRTNQNGTSCCEVADGHRLEDTDWRVENDGSYSVHFDGKWRAVPPDAVLTSPNPTGYTIVWVWQDIIECFLPGSQT